MSQTKIISIIGTRPSYIKAIPVIQKLQEKYFMYTIDSGQHSSENMSQSFLNYFNFQPDYIIDDLPNNFEKRRRKIFAELDQRFSHLGADYNTYVLVFGDTDTTMLSALFAYNNSIKIIHIESGFRSGKSIMREERNRIIVDNLSHILFCTEQFGIDCLNSEGITQNTFLVGNSIIDSLKHIELKNSINRNLYYLLTLHRPELVDNIGLLYRCLRDMNNFVNFNNYKIIFPIHPRTQNKLGDIVLYAKELNKINFVEPQNYSDFINLIYNSRGVITDSGGVQAETAWLKKKCFTLRTTTEQPSTVLCGSNKLIDGPYSSVNIENGFIHIENNTDIKDIPLWDGNASDRILSALKGMGL